MDLHSLPRRALQLLCKRNSIPANTTNIAMAEALHSLQTVMGLEELEQNYQTPIKIPTRPPNPPRTCQQNSMLTSILSTNPKKKKRAEQELPNSPTLKRSRTLRPRSGSSTKKEDDAEEEKPLTCARRRRYRSVKPMLRCSSSVQQNAAILESSQSAFGGVQGDEAMHRSIGIQVDIGVDHFGDSLFEILTTNLSDARVSTAPQDRQGSPVGLNMKTDVDDHISSKQTTLLEIGGPVTKSHEPDDPVGGLASHCDVEVENGKCHRDIGWENERSRSDEEMRVEIKASAAAAQNSIELNRCLDLINRDQETTSPYCGHSHKEHDEKHVNSSTNLTKKNLEGSDIQQAPLLGPGDQIVKSHELAARIVGPVLNCDPVLGNSEGDSRGSVVIHRKIVEDTNTHEEYEEAKSDGKTRVETRVTVALQNQLELNQCLDPVKEDQEATSSYCLPTNKKDSDALSPRNIQVSIHLHERSLESSSLQLIVREPTDLQEVMLSSHPLPKSCELDADVGLPALNCDPVCEHSLGTCRKNGEGPEKDGGNDEVKSDGGTWFESKAEERSVKTNYLSGLSLSKLRLLCKENRNVIRCESKRGTLREEDREEKMVKAKFDGLSLRKLKFLCKNKVNKQQQYL